MCQENTENTANTANEDTEKIQTIKQIQPMHKIQLVQSERNVIQPIYMILKDKIGLPYDSLESELSLFLDELASLGLMIVTHRPSGNWLSYTT